MGRLPTKQPARVIVIDPKQPKRVYALTDSSVVRSDDAGQTWHAAAQGLPARGLLLLALDPQHPARLYAATASGALYSSDDAATSWQIRAGGEGGA